MLTARQRKLLKIIIDEYIRTAEAVGSLAISDRYNLDVSPATIRNEMVRLAQLGFLDKDHASAGRRPTTDALRWFLDDVMDELESLDVVATSSVRENLFQQRFDVDRMLQEAVRSLAKLTNNTAVSMLHGRRYIAGLAQFLDQPEYHDYRRLKKMLAVMEDYSTWSDLFTKFEGGDDIKVLIGEETGVEEFGSSAVVFASIKVHGNDKGYLGVIGPNRMNYRRVIPAMKYIASTISDAVEGW